jgi:glycosyltransferase involved in cell wall biosynthesis
MLEQQISPKLDYAKVQPRAIAPKTLPENFKVLIAEFDLYSSLGGGQTFYREMIKLHPNIQFYYIQKSPHEFLVRPNNAIPLEFRWKHKPDDFLNRQSSRLAWLQADALNIAESAKGIDFNIVDFPDYSQFGLFLKPAFQAIGLKNTKIAVSMHGSISTTMMMNFGGAKISKEELDEIRFIERLQFESSDIRYGISQYYVSEWLEKTGIKASILDPLYVVPTDASTDLVGKDLEPVVPEILFVGRSEKRKGPEIAVDLVSSLPSRFKKKLIFVGEKSTSFEGWSSDILLIKYAQNRNVEVEFTGRLTPQQVYDRFRSNSIIMAPSRYDTLNLTCLEALFAGCPTLIGNGAGVCDYLDTNYPNIPYVKVDTNQPFNVLSQFVDLLDNYSARKKELINAVNLAKPQLAEQPLNAIYSLNSSAEKTATEVAFSQYNELKNVQRDFKKPILSQIKLSFVGFLKRRLIQLKVVKATRSRINFVKEAGFGRIIAALMIKVLSRLRIFDSVMIFVRFTVGLIIGQKQLRNGSVKRSRYGRAQLYLRKAFIEERLGRFAVAAAYGSRALRWAGELQQNLGNRIEQWTTLAGFSSELEVQKLLCANDTGNNDQIFSYLSSRRTALAKNPAVVFETVIDKRNHSVPAKVSVIVSMYMASSKFQEFIDRLNDQTMLDKGEVELVLIESGSPDGKQEMQKILSVLDSYPKIPYVLCRTKDRETIQSAWNRGLSVCKAPYVCFLGVDEALRPDALEILTRELDVNPTLDWAMGDSVITEVSPTGEWQSDLMRYDRNGLTKYHHILECCFVSYVGGLYRKSIHDRVGYYDASFRAAGDTEFKNRAMPFIEVKHIPETMGYFLNYPEERTTQHPRAEIEDQRAWYIFRTAQGLEYYTQNFSQEDLVALLKTCLGYRKSYCGHISIDLDIASAIIQFDSLKEFRLQNPQLTNCILRAAQSLKEIDSQLGSRFKRLRVMINCIVQFKRLEKQCKNLGLPLKWSSMYHDNRYEQHSNVWG